MAKQSTILKETKKLTLNTMGQLLVDDGMFIETEDMGVLDLSTLLETFNGKLVKISVTEQSDDLLDIE